MSRIPFGGYAVLDIARPLRLENEGALHKKAVRFHLSETGLDSSPCREQNRQLRRLGSATSSVPWTSGGELPRQQSACQMEAPSLHRTPIMHLALSNPASTSANRSVADLRLSCSQSNPRSREVPPLIHDANT